MSNETLATRYIGYTVSLLLFLSISAFLINSLIYHFPGNSYFPPHTFFVALSLLLMYTGFLLQLGKSNTLVAIFEELIFFFTVMSVIALATNAVQLTPFSPIDKKIIAMEMALHINIKMLMSWAHMQSTLIIVLGFIYDTLPYQMIYLPLIVIIMRRSEYIREYYFLMLVSTLIGFTFYYFFPTTAPASIIKSNFFNEAQQATGLKFFQIHHYIQPTTLDGGMIAFPSFHVIWAWYCLYLIRSWRWGLFILCPINLMLVVSCVLLGWHYLTDIVGAFAVLVITQGIYSFCRRMPIDKKAQNSSIICEPS